MTERVTMEPGAIPALHLPAAEPGAPAMILQHGFGADKYDLEPVAEEMQRAGVALWLPDALDHGERFDPRGKHPAYDYTADDFVRLLERTRDELAALAAGLRAAGHARVFLAGFSLGGMAAILATEHDPAVAGLLTFAGGAAPDLLTAPLALGPVSAAAAAWVHQTDMGAPLNATRLNPRPCLLLHGRADDVLPASGSQRLYDAARPAYAAQPERLRLRLHAGSHAITPPMLAEALAWIAEYR